MHLSSQPSFFEEFTNWPSSRCIKRAKVNWPEWTLVRVTGGREVHREIDMHVSFTIPGPPVVERRA